MYIFDRLVTPVSATFSIQGKPHNTKLSEAEKRLFGEIGIDPPSYVFTYRGLLIHYSRRLIIADSRSNSTKRNNSCIFYKSGYGLVHKIFTLSRSFDQVFVLVKELQPIHINLCNDDVTHANFDSHFCAFQPHNVTNKILAAGEIVHKCVYIDSGKSLPFVFVSLLPNYSELE